MSRSRKRRPFCSVYNGNDSDDRRIFRRNQRHHAKQKLKVESPEEFLYPVRSEAGDQGDIHSRHYWSKRDVIYMAKVMMTTRRGDGYWENLQRYMKEWYRCMRK